MEDESKYILVHWFINWYYVDNNIEEDNSGLTSPNPDGFFSDLENNDACSVAVAVRVRPLVGRELTSGNGREVI